MTGSMKYTPTIHAIERAQHRLGIDPAQAKRWFNETIRQARYLFTQKVKGVDQLVYEFESNRFVIDSRNNLVVTIKPSVDTSILTPVFEREHRKLRREVTRLTRRHELAIAELTVQMGERLIAKAKAKNPKTRELIQQDIDALQAKISRHEASITREQDRLENFVRATGIYV